MATGYLAAAQSTLTPPTSFSYQTSQQNPFQPSTLVVHTSRQPRTQKSSTVRCVIWFIIIAFIAISILSTIAWLVLHPHVPVFQLNSLSLSNFTLSTSKLTSNYHIEFTVTNPNQKMNVNFESFRVGVFYKKSLLTSTYVHPFSLTKLGQRGLSVELNSSSSDPVLNEGIHDEIRENYWDQRLIRFNVRMVVVARFESGEWLSKKKSMEVFCENLKVGFSLVNMTGNLMGGSSQCLAYSL